MARFETFGQVRGSQGNSSGGDFDRESSFRGADASNTVEDSGRGRPLGSDLLFLFILFPGLEIADAHLPPVLQLTDGLTKVVFIFQVHGEVLEVLMVHHAGEGLGFVVQVAFFLGAFLVKVVVSAVLEEFMFEDYFFPVGTGGEACIVDSYDEEFEFHFGFQFAVSGVYAIARFECHGLDSLFGFVVVFGFEFQSPGHVTLDLMTGRNGGGGLLLGRGRSCCFSYLLSFLNSSFLAGLKLLPRYFFYET